MNPPKEMAWLFWEVDLREIDVERDADFVMARVLERGRLVDVQWLLRAYGESRIHGFFTRVAHPELSPRTLAFWRAYFDAQDERWPSPPAWRRNSTAPWPG